MPNDILLPRILLTNDDGFDSPGLQILAGIAAEFAQEIWIVAPEEDQSGASQKISLRQAISANRRSERSWSIKGTPGDCVALALDYLMADAKPSLVISGINATSNVGDEVNLSGTVGAAMMALMMDVPAIAVSQNGPSRTDVPWDTARTILPLILRRVLADGWKKETALCVNIPALPPEEIKGFRWSRQAQKNIAGVKAYRRVSPRGEEYFWLVLHDKEPLPQTNSDISIMNQGFASITPLAADRSFDIGKSGFLFTGAEGAAETEIEQDSDADQENDIALEIELSPDPESDLLAS